MGHRSTSDVDRPAASLIKGIRGEHHSNLPSGIYIENRHWEDHRFTTGLQLHNYLHVPVNKD